MDIRFLGKNLSVTEGMKEHLRQKLVKLEKYSPRLVESHVVLRKEKYFYEAEITLSAKNLRAYGEGASEENIYTAIDKAYTRIEKQLKKYREKIKEHHKSPNPKNPNANGRKSAALREPAARSAMAGTEKAERPAIIRSPSFAPKPMSLEEASMQLELSLEPFLVFQNASTQQVNVIYKRSDGNHGLVEPDF